MHVLGQAFGFTGPGGPQAAPSRGRLGRRSSTPPPDDPQGPPGHAAAPHTELLPPANAQRRPGRRKAAEAMDAGDVESPHARQHWYYHGGGQGAGSLAAEPSGPAAIPYPQATAGSSGSTPSRQLTHSHQQPRNQRQHHGVARKSSNSHAHGSSSTTSTTSHAAWGRDAPDPAALLPTSTPPASPASHHLHHQAQPTPSAGDHLLTTHHLSHASPTWCGGSNPQPRVPAAGAPSPSASLHWSEQRYPSTSTTPVSRPAATRHTALVVLATLLSLGLLVLGLVGVALRHSPAGTGHEWVSSSGSSGRAYLASPLLRPQDLSRVPGDPGGQEEGPAGMDTGRGTGDGVAAAGSIGGSLSGQEQGDGAGSRAHAQQQQQLGTEEWKRQAGGAPGAQSKALDAEQGFPGTAGGEGAGSEKGTDATDGSKGGVRGRTARVRGSAATEPVRGSPTAGAGGARPGAAKTSTAGAHTARDSSSPSGDGSSSNSSPSGDGISSSSPSGDGSGDSTSIASSLMLSSAVLRNAAAAAAAVAAASASSSGRLDPYAPLPLLVMPGDAEEQGEFHGTVSSSRINSAGARQDDGDVTTGSAGGAAGAQEGVGHGEMGEGEARAPSVSVVKGPGGGSSSSSSNSMKGIKLNPAHGSAARDTGVSQAQASGGVSSGRAEREGAVHSVARAAAHDRRGEGAAVTGGLPAPGEVITGAASIGAAAGGGAYGGGGGGGGDGDGGGGGGGGSGGVGSGDGGGHSGPGAFAAAPVTWAQRLAAEVQRGGGSDAPGAGGCVAVGYGTTDREGLRAALNASAGTRRLIDIGKNGAPQRSHCYCVAVCSSRSDRWGGR